MFFGLFLAIPLGYKKLCTGIRLYSSKREKIYTEKGRKGQKLSSREGIKSVVRIFVQTVNAMRRAHASIILEAQ